MPLLVIWYDMKKTPPAKSRFTRDLMIAFLVLTIAVIGAVSYFTVKAQRDISRKYINDATRRATDAFETMATTMGSDLRLIRDWVQADKLSLLKSKSLNDLLFPILKRDSVLYGISIADTNGESYYVAEVPEGWRTSRTGMVGTKRQSVRRVWTAERELLSEKQAQSDYDPRQRPWFFPAISAGDVFWTTPYAFFGRHEVGITASIATGKSAGKKQFVVALDILLDDLFQEIQGMGPSKNSRVLIFKRDAQLYVSESKDAGPGFLAANEFKEPLIQKVMDAWMDQQAFTGKVLSIRQDNETWWCGFRALENASRSVWIGVIVPEADIIGGIAQRRMGLWAVGLVLVVIAGGLTFWMTRRYGRSLGMPGEKFDSRRPEESIQSWIARGEGRTLEFKATMRRNLHTGKNGKEIETAWLKAVAAFMNTDGGTLLLGVTDDGQISGLGPDDFANEDKCQLHFKNLISQHIGAEFSRHLHFRVAQVEGQQVGIVTCARSPEPVFLKTGKKEAFYIRNGPASDELSVSKVVAYIQSRG